MITFSNIIPTLIDIKPSMNLGDVTIKTLHNMHNELIDNNIPLTHVISLIQGTSIKPLNNLRLFKDTIMSSILLGSSIINHDDYMDEIKKDKVENNKRYSKINIINKDDDYISLINSSTHLYNRVRDLHLLSYMNYFKDIHELMIQMQDSMSFNHIARIITTIIKGPESLTELYGENYKHLIQIRMNKSNYINRRSEVFGYSNESESIANTKDATIMFTNVLTSINNIITESVYRLNSKDGLKLYIISSLNSIMRTAAVHAQTITKSMNNNIDINYITRLTNYSLLSLSPLLFKGVNANNIRTINMNYNHDHISSREISPLSMSLSAYQIYSRDTFDHNNNIHNDLYQNYYHKYSIIEAILQRRHDDNIKSYVIRRTLEEIINDELRRYGYY
jgi:hypothetical protein